VLDYVRPDLARLGLANSGYFRLDLVGSLQVTFFILSLFVR
jgi:hypothetical protein